jgi:hypothetical protein
MTPIPRAPTNLGDGSSAGPRCLAVIAALVLLVGCGPEKHTTPTVYEIPASVSGWIVVQFNESTAPALPMIGGKRVVRIPPSGFLATSSPQETGIIDRKFYQIAADGTRTTLDDISSRYHQAGESEQDDAQKTSPTIFVCCTHTGDSTAHGNHRYFEGFYVGHGPAGNPPDWPTSPTTR